MEIPAGCLMCVSLLLPPSLPPGCDCCNGGSHLICTHRLVPAFWYNPLWSQVAAGGSVVLSLDVLTALPTNYETSARYLEEIFEWVQGGHLAAWLQDNVPKVIVDPKQLVLAGHSSGAQSVIWAYPTLRKSIRAILLLDPVDSFGEPRNRSTAATNLSPFPSTSDSASTTSITTTTTTTSTTARSAPFPFPPLNPAILPRLKLTEDDSRGAVIDPQDPEQYQDYHAPMLFLSTGLCHLSTFQIPSPDIPQLPPFLKDSLWPACCPRGLGPRRFWNAFPQADRWNLNATEFGHCDLLATPWALFNRVTGLCKTNLDLSPTSSSTASIVHVSRFRAWMAARIDAFFDLTLYNKCEAKALLENQETHPIPLQLEKSYWSQSQNPCLRKPE